MSLATIIWEKIFLKIFLIIYFTKFSIKHLHST
jgi:hypothetical protein